MRVSDQNQIGFVPFNQPVPRASTRKTASFRKLASFRQIAAVGQASWLVHPARFRTASGPPIIPPSATLQELASFGQTPLSPPPKPKQKSTVTENWLRSVKSQPWDRPPGLLERACGPRIFLKKWGSLDVAGLGSTGSRLKPAAARIGRPTQRPARRPTARHASR